MKIASIRIPALLAAVMAATGGCLARSPDADSAPTTSVSMPPPASPAPTAPAPTSPPAPAPPAPPAPASAAAWRPILFNSLKYDKPTQGPLSRRVSRELGIPLLPIAYHGGVDWFADGKITPKDKELFRGWIERSFPMDYTGPACLDYEAPLGAWSELCARTIETGRLREILAVYDEGLAYARTFAPNAAWGYWGLPAMRHTSSGWKDQGNSLTDLLMKSGAVFPAAYDCHPGLQNTESFQKYVSQVLADVAGTRPVYPFVWNRFCGQGKRHVFASQEEMLANADAVLRAQWTDDQGVEHRVAGIVLWDSFYLGARQTSEELDELHASYLEGLDALVKSHALVAGGP